ncbi:MAG TPA: hypothetical protein ENH62_07680 [Marinobacter sp.]|uniref:Uncharacterized protein n=1 Tax=marine sediment metagenome TaxID=412755 RepID=A0A0F9QVK6_9ZZZZ|nr:hypothetical protein [Marinobacter sp.]
MTHTPGPWNLNGGPNPTNPRHYTVYVKPEGPETVEHICSVSDRMSPDWKTNAKLIAAAPKLLEALEVYQQTSPVQRATWKWHTAWYEQMTAAIKAAT